MKRPHNYKRITAMHQMLFEMARGNFNRQIPGSGLDDELETLVVLMNMVAEELKESVLFSGFINPHGNQMLVASATLLLDEGDRIADASSGALGLLGYEASELIRRPIADVLSGGMEAYGMMKRQLSGNSRFVGRTSLHFISASSLSVTAECSLERLAGGKGWVLSCLAPHLVDLVTEGENQEKSIGKGKYPSRSDARLIQKVYDYILGHLHEPLPRVKDLSRQFGTNEFKLKEGFRHFLHNSIYQFYTEERLKRAYFMIEQSEIPLKKIAQMNGFNSYPNFSRTFKRRFGLSPKDLARK